MARKPKPVQPGVTGPAADALREWDATGRPRSELARMIGRDPKVFRDIASGSKPYRELGGAIRAGARGHEQLAAERGIASRRRTSEGGLARTRGTYRTPAGSVLSGRSRAAHARMLAELRAMQPGQRVTITVQLTSGQLARGREVTPQEPTDVTLGGTGGMTKDAALPDADLGPEPDDDPDRWAREQAEMDAEGPVDEWIDHLLGMIEDGDAGGVDGDSETVAQPGGVATITVHVR